MANKTINQALKDLFLGLGGDSSALADNTSASDYIEDLESAIKETASDVIDDSEASDATTYSSNKIASLIPAQDTVYINVNINTSTKVVTPVDSTITANVINDLLQEGKQVILKHTKNNLTSYYHLSHRSTGFFIGQSFTCILDDSGDLDGQQIKFWSISTSAGSDWTYNEIIYKPTT